MKVFDFTDGNKGELLAEVKLVDQVGSFIVVKDGVRFKVAPVQTERFGGEVRWAEYADNRSGDLKPETFGVEAILFCMGELFTMGSHGHPDAESHFEWIILGTTEWNREACKNGILKATKLGEVK